MIKLGIIFGGRSEEHEVSRMSATSVMGAVDTSKYEIIPIGITKDGRWYLYDGPVEKIVTGEWEDYAVRALAEDPENYSFSVVGAGGRSLKDIIDFALPVVHGTYCEDGSAERVKPILNQCPMCKGLSHGKYRSFTRKRSSTGCGRRFRHVKDRLAHGPEENPRADAAVECDRKPSTSGFAFVPPRRRSPTRVKVRPITMKRMLSPKSSRNAPKLSERKASSHSRLLARRSVPAAPTMMKPSVKVSAGKSVRKLICLGERTKGISITHLYRIAECNSKYLEFRYLVLVSYLRNNPHSFVR